MFRMWNKVWKMLKKCPNGQPIKLKYSHISMRPGYLKYQKLSSSHVMVILKQISTVFGNKLLSGIQGLKLAKSPIVVQWQGNKTVKVYVIEKFKFPSFLTFSNWITSDTCENTQNFLYQANYLNKFLLFKNPVRIFTER